MSEQFEGVVNILSSDGKTVSIVLNGDAPGVFALPTKTEGGGAIYLGGKTLELTPFPPEGHFEEVQLWGLWLCDKTGATIVQIDTSATLSLGATGHAGSINLVGASGNQRISADAADGSLSLFPDSAKFPQIVADNLAIRLTDAQGKQVIGLDSKIGIQVTQAEWGVGVHAESQNAQGVYGISHGNNAAGVYGFNDAPQPLNCAGVWGESQHGEGVHGISHGQNAGVSALNVAPQGAAAPALYAESQNWEGVHSVAHSLNAAAISAIAPAGGNAGYFEGSVTVTGNVTVTGDVLLTGADCAEEFESYRRKPSRAR
jgi:hypothetical protein